MDLTEEQWKVIKRFIPKDAVREDGRGRPWSDRRRAFNEILWILRTGAPWQDLPERYGAYQTVHRRFQQWRKQGLVVSKKFSKKKGHGIRGVEEKNPKPERNHDQERE